MGNRSTDRQGGPCRWGGWRPVPWTSGCGSYWRWSEKRRMAALCRRFGVSRKSGYKWLGRYREEGVAGLADRSRAPRHHPQEVSAELAERCLEVRRAHPTWGPVKARAVLERGLPRTARAARRSTR